MDQNIRLMYENPQDRDLLCGLAKYRSDVYRQLVTVTVVPFESQMDANAWIDESLFLYDKEGNMKPSENKLTLTERVRREAIKTETQDASWKNLYQIAIEVAALEAELADLRSKLAFTADGEPVQPGDHLHSTKESSPGRLIAGYAIDTRNQNSEVLLDLLSTGHWVFLSDCYSTTEARDKALIGPAAAQEPT